MEHFFSRFQEKMVIKGEEDKLIWWETEYKFICQVFFSLGGDLGKNSNIRLALKERVDTD